MQDRKKVKFADVHPTTREKFKIFVSRLKLDGRTISGHRIKTLEDGMLYAMMQAERVPELEKENRELKEKIKECEE
jgi:hypothetical protein